MEDILKEILYELKEVRKGIRVIESNSNPAEIKLLIDGKEITTNVIKCINDKNKISRDIKIMV